MESGKKRESKRKSLPGVEALEGRAVPATFHAASVNALIAEIAQVDNTQGPNTIILASKGFRLTSQLQIQNAGDLTIEGNTDNPDSSVLFGAAGSRVFEIDGGNVTLSSMTIEGGNTVERGGGIDSQNANVTVDRSVINDNSAHQMGGGIYADGGTLAVDSTSFSGDEVGGEANVFGGAIAATNASVTLTKSAIRNTGAYSSGVTTQGAALSAGGAVFTSGGTLSISGSTLANDAAFAGSSGPTSTTLGGAVATADTTASVSSSTIEDNTVSIIASQAPIAQGGAFSTNGGTLTISSSTLNGNGSVLPNKFASSFFNPDGTVKLQNTIINGQKYAGSFTLGDNGFTPDS